MATKVRLDLFNGKKGYSRGKPFAVEAVWYLVKVCFFLSALPYPNAFKSFLLRLFGAKVGKGLVIKPRVNIHMPWKLEIGDHVWIGEEVFILNFERVTIGNQVCVSQRVFLCGGNHDYKQPDMPYRNGPITLENGCWVGASCFVAPNVVIGEEAIVAAGTVVTRTLPPNGIYRGNPVERVKNRW